MYSIAERQPIDGQDAHGRRGEAAPSVGVEPRRPGLGGSAGRGLLPPSACATLDNPALCAADVCRGVTRMLLRHDLVAMAEVPLDNGRRADLMALDAKGRIVIVEIKVSRADLLGDGKWPDYLSQCDRFYWALPAGFDLGPLDGPAFLPERTGVIVADQYDAEIVREAGTEPLPAHVRKRGTLSFARRAARRALSLSDPEAYSA